MDAHYIAPPHSYARPMWRGLRRIGIQPIAMPPPLAAREIQSKPGTPGLAPIALSGMARICPGPMVYTRGEAMSVIIASRTVDRLDGCTGIMVSGESRTSVLYLKIILDRLGLKPRVDQAPYTSPRELLSRAPCALLLGDEALKARRQYRVVEDLGLLARKVLGVNPVFAATMIHPRTRCPGRLSRYRPEPSPLDPAITSARTGMPLHEAERYHKAIRLDYNPAELARALRVLGIKPGIRLGGAPGLALR